MKHNLFLLLAGLMLVGCSRSVTTENNYPKTDSLMRVVTALVADEQPEQAMRVIDTAQAAGYLAPVMVDVARACAYSHAEMDITQVEPLLLPWLEKDLTPKQRREVLGELTHAARLRRDNGKVMQYGTEYISLCEQTGATTKALQTQAEIGSVLVHLGRTDEGLQAIDEAILGLDTERQFAALDASIIALKRKIRILLDLKRYAEVPPVCNRLLEKLADYEEHYADYSDGSQSEPQDAERRAGYIDFYRGQAYAFLAYARASIDEDTEAKEALHQFEQTRYSKTFGGEKLISSTWFLLGQYDRLLPFYDDLQHYWGSDTLHHDYGIMLRHRAYIAYTRGQGMQSAELWRRYAHLQEELNTADREAEVQEYAALYHEQEQQRLLQAEQAKRKRTMMAVVFLCVIVLLISVFAVVLIRQLQLIRRKNAVLSREIAENVEYKEKYLRMQIQPMANNLTSNSDSGLSTTETDLNNMSDKDLFDFLSKVIVENRLYLNPQISRNLLMEKYNLRKERIGSAFSQGSEYGALPAFISECRLTHSVHLLIEQPDMSITDIATASGYTNTSTFFAGFKQRYAMTPNEFRRKNLSSY